MKFEKLNITRKALMWFFDWPANPYVCLNVSVDFTQALEYLDAVNAASETRVSVHHLVVGCVAKTMEAFPCANARVINRRIQRIEGVGVAMPVSLIGHAGSSAAEVGMAIVEDADKKDLRGIAAATRKQVAAERTGRPPNPFIRAVTRAVEATPYPLLARGLDGLNRLVRTPRAAELLYRQIPFSTVVTNVGSSFGSLEGAMFRGGAAVVPTDRLVSVGSVWGVAPLQDEVIPIDGAPAVRKCLPLMMMFDHRLFDGVMASRIIKHLIGLLSDPEGCFGPAS